MYTYTIKKLAEKQKVMYYTNYQKTKMFPLTEKPSLEEVKELSIIVGNLMLDSSNDKSGLIYLTNLLMDLKYLMTDGKEYECVTLLGKESVDFEDLCSLKVKENFLQSSPTTKEVAHLLRFGNSCLVGGCVRDSILGLKAKDFDFVTDISYDRLEIIFKEAGFIVKEEGKNFLVMIVSKNGEQFEIANYRKDGLYEDGRRPEEVAIGTIFDDALRRDFTINALYYNLNEESIVGPNGQGLEDIHSKTLRFVGKVQDRLQEDSLRVFRFYRFLHKLPDFKAANKDLKNVRTEFNKAYEKTTPERVRLEIEKMLDL